MTRRGIIEPDVTTIWRRVQREDGEIILEVAFCELSSSEKDLVVDVYRVFAECTPSRNPVTDGRKLYVFVGDFDSDPIHVPDWPVREEVLNEVEGQK